MVEFKPNYEDAAPRKSSKSRYVSFVGNFETLKKVSNSSKLYFRLISQLWSMKRDVNHGQVGDRAMNAKSHQNHDRREHATTMSIYKFFYESFILINFIISKFHVASVSYMVALKRAEVE